MKKQEQVRINAEIERAMDRCNEVFYDTPDTKTPPKIRVGYCQAWTQEFEHFTVLWSYRTVVAVYDRLNGVLYDILRGVYGYTATSAKHIAKFRTLVHPAKILVWREV